MAGDYPGTAVPYPEMALPDLRDPVLSGPGHRALEDSIASYHQLARGLADAGGAVRALLTTARVAHEGEAAEASQRALRTLSEPGELGAQQSLLAARALEDQGSYVARVRSDMQAADPGPTVSGAEAAAAVAISPTTAPVVAGAAVVGYIERHTARDQAAEAAGRYQDNTNWNLGAGFQAFPAPHGPNPDTGPGAVGATGGGAVPAFQIGPAGTLGATGTAGVALGAGGGAAAGHLPGTGSGGAAAVGPVPVLPGGATSGAAGGRPGSAGPGVAGSAAAGSGRAGTNGTGTGGIPSGGSTTAAGSGGGTTGGRAGAPGTGPADRKPGAPGTSGVPVGPGPVGSGVGLAPQGYRPGRGTGGRIDPESGILSGAPPLPGNGVISPGESVGSDRRMPAWGSAVPDGQVDRAPLERPTPQSGAPAGTTARGATPGQTGMPFLGGAGAGGGSDREHRRPSWLVQDDPEAFWFADLPAHSDPVITPDVDE